MAKYHYDLTGAEAIIRDVPIYAAATIAYGEMLQAADLIAGTAGAGFITSNALTSTCGVDALGMCNETITTTSKADWGDIISTAATTTTDAISSIASTVAEGSRYGKAIINPYAVYELEWDDSSASYWTCAANAGTTTYTDTVERYVEGSWFYVVPAGSTDANAGQLRYITTTSTTANWTLLSAMTTTTSDSGLLIRKVNHRIHSVNATAGVPTKLSNLAANDAGGCISYHTVENFIESPYRVREPLRAQAHNGLTDSNLKFVSDIVQLDHVYCSAVTAS